MFDAGIYVVRCPGHTREGLARWAKSIQRIKLERESSERSIKARTALTDSGNITCHGGDNGTNEIRKHTPQSTEAYSSKASAI